MLLKPLPLSLLLCRALAAQLPKGSSAYVLPMNDPYPTQRSEEVQDHRNGFLYGPSLIGNTSYFPTGPLGDGLVKAQIALGEAEADANEKVILEEAKPVYEAVMKVGWRLLLGRVSRESTSADHKVQASGLQGLDSFSILYENQWANANPTGILPGSYTNYTQDLFFSMERLSVSPFSLVRLNPKTSKLPFAIEDPIVKNLTTMTLSGLHSAGRLFFVDHSYAAHYPKEPNRYAAACSAYFYIHPSTGDFLPLAIKTNVGSNLTYTPADSEEDWLLAKMMFNNNDLFYSQVYHLDSTHDVAEIVNLAALRTMTNEHPVRGYLERGKKVIS